MTKNEIIHQILNHLKWMKSNVEDLYDYKWFKHNKKWLEEVEECLWDLKEAINELWALKSIPLIEFEQRY